MKHWHEEMPFTADNSLAELIFTENSLFFDIETTCLLYTSDAADD